MEKKSLLIQGLEEYFDNTPKEELEKDLNELESYNEYVPTIKEHPILQKLNNYLSNTSEEQLQQDWEELKQYQEMGGPTIEEFLTPHITIGIAECGSQYSQYNSFDGWEMKRTNVQEHYYVYKDGHCLSDYDTYEEASEHSKRIDGDVFTEHTEPICWNDMSDEDKANFFITPPHYKKKAIYKLGDKFTRKGTRDSNVLKIKGIEYVSGLDTQYELQSITGNLTTKIGEEALTELYSHITKTYEENH